jgi:4-amino-4-deoxy-L-arabinose transferase-like glycosyltransferase
MFMGFDGLTSARIAIALCGAILLLCSWLIAARFGLSEDTRLIALLIAALLISFWTIQNIGSDVLVAAFILCYIYLVTDPNLLTWRKVPFICGIVGGIAYLAHHYAFPFFLVHFPVLLLTRGYIDRDRLGFPWKKIIISWWLGIAGFIIIASVWIGIVSVKSGRFIISSSGGPAHAVMGPKDVDRRHPFFVGGLFKPKETYAIHVFEDASEVEFKTWSPFESKEYFIHQLRVVKMNLVYILNHFVNNSPFFTYAFVIGILVLIPVAFFLTPLNNRKKYLYAWTFLTFSIYCSGFVVLIARSPRRFYSLMIIFLFLSFHFMEELLNALRDKYGERNTKILAWYVVLIVCSAFAIKPSLNLIKSVKHIAMVDQVNPYKDIADQIDKVEFPAPYAIIRSSQKLTTDYYITYFLKKQLLGRPDSRDVDRVTEELKTAGGKSLVVFDNHEITEKLKVDGRYSHKGSLKLNSSKRYNDSVKWVVAEHEIIAGWDEEVNIFILKR